MTHRLLVNPDTPHAWEIPLPPGTVRIGRRDDNHHKIDHPSVSSAHCEIIVDGESVQIRDLGSTNGTFINRAPVREAWLVPGQHLQLGSVDMRFESNASFATASMATVPMSNNPLRLAISRPAPVETPAEPELSEPEIADPPIPPPLMAPAGMTNAGEFFCKSHPKTAARFYCSHCQKYFCELCVTTRATASASGKFCRTCASALTTLQIRPSAPVAPKSFYSRIPGAFVFPFKGFGVVMLLFAAAIFGGVDYLVRLGILRSPMGWAIRVSVYGLLFLFLQNIILTTTSDEKEQLGFPEAGDLWGAAFQFTGTFIASFALALGLIIAKFFEVNVPTAAIVVAVIIGCLYFPMAFLAVAMKESVMAANPLVVIPTIQRVPLEYFVTTMLLLAVFGLRFLGNMVSDEAGGTALSTKDMTEFFVSLGVQAFCAFFSIYLLTVNMRVLGLLYNAKKNKFGWFNH